MRVAVIGAGRMGRRHIQVVKELGLELAGACDSRPEALRLAEAEQGVPADKLFLDARRLFEAARPECAIVATTAPTHCEYTCLAAEHGVAFVMCEKPMAVSLAECDRMIATCEGRGARLAINHQMRFMEQYTVPKAIVEAGSFGGLASVIVAGGNFGMAMNGTHYFEMFRFITGEAPDTVTAWFSERGVPNPRGPQFEDRAGAVRLTTPSGRRFYMEVGDDQGHGVKVIYSGRLGQLAVDELSGLLRLETRQEADRDLPTTRYGMPSKVTERRIDPADAVAPSKAVLESLVHDRNPPTGRDGRLAVATLVGAYLSHERSHVAVPLPAVEEAAERVFPWA